MTLSKSETIRCSGSYDAINRLTSAAASGGTNGLYSETYTYYPASGNLASKGGLTYTYADPAHAHAVTGLSNGNNYAYDPNGDMVQRVVGGQTYNLGYDAENRMISVSGAATASFLYDGDGKRVMSTIGASTTYFVGNIYEVGNGVVTKYYYAGGQRIAMRNNGVVSYLLGDHLDSTSLTTDAAGLLSSEQRYTAWGEVRYSGGSVPTKYQFTGQYSNVADFGMLFYNARWYDSYLNRFTQPDSIIPDPYNSLDYDRYSYARSNPLKYSDPSGHVPEWFYIVLGATAQYMDDMSLGLFSHAAGSLDNVNISAYQDGREYGREVSIIQASVETAVGAYIAAASVAAVGPTAGGGLACAVVTGGVCAAPAGVAVTAEAAGVVGGTIVAGHGALMMAKMKGSQPGNSTTPQYRILSAGEIKMLEDAGFDVHELKGGDGASAYDLYKDNYGNIVVKRKGGIGPGEDLGINVRNLPNVR